MTARAVSEWQAAAGGTRDDGSVVLMPAALERARALDAWCQRYGCLPWAGSLMEQPAIPFLKWQNTLAASSVEPARGAAAIMDIPMVSL